MKPSSLCVFAASVASLLASCVHHARRNPSFPERPSNCELRIFHGPVPRGVYFDDLGPADAGCYIETPRQECMRQLRAEACRMGGDIIYDLPEKPTRPEWREYHFKGSVGHTRPLRQSDIDEGRAPPDAKLGAPSASAPETSDVPGGDGTGEPPADGGAETSPASAPVVPLGTVSADAGTP